VDVMCVKHLVVTATTTWRSKQQIFVATSSRVLRWCRQTAGHRKTVPKVRQRATGSVASSPPAVPVGPPLQSDRSPTSGPTWTGTPDGPQTSTDIINRCDDVDLTDVKTFDFPFAVSSTVSATADATVTVPYSARFLVNFSRLFDASTLNMLPHDIAEGLAPNITVTIHSVQTPMMLDSGAQISVLPSDIVADFDPPILLSSVTREVRTFGNHQVTLRGPLSLELQLCGFRLRRPFYFIDASTPVIGGYDLMKAARLVVDVENGLVWSRRPEAVQNRLQRVR